jgi:hypothetical protein
LICECFLASWAFVVFFGLKLLMNFLNMLVKSLFGFVFVGALVTGICVV